MSQIRSSMAWVLGAWALLGPSHAMGVVRNDDTVGDPELFPSAVMMGDPSSYFCSGTVIGGGRYVITAEHCLLRGTDASAYVFMQGPGSTLTGLGTVAVHPFLDLAIIPLAGQFTDSVSIPAPSDWLGREISFAGYGRSSDVADGGGPGTGMQELPIGTARAGSNIVDFLGDTVIGFDFDLAGGVGVGGLGDAEATTFVGDSGMGYFTELASGGFGLIGVHTGIAPPPPVNRDQAISYGVRLDGVRGWISQNVPSPAPLALGALATVRALRRRRAAQI